MDYSVLHSSVIAILSAVITGGFVLVFVEIGNRKNREQDRFRQLMQPFIEKLSAYCRFMSWSVSQIQFPKEGALTGYEERFKKLIHKFSAMGGKLIVAGGNYRIDDFNSEGLQEVCNQINDIWYQYDKMNPKRISWSFHLPYNEYVNKELSTINPLWLSLPESVEKIVKVSADFYTDIYRTLEDDIFRHDLMMKIYRGHSIFVLGALFVVLLGLCLLMCFSFSPLFLRIITILVVGLFGVSLFAIFVDEKKQLKIAVKVIQFMQDKKKFNMKSILKKWSEPAGLIILLGSFIWQMFSVYQTQSIYNDKIYKVETSLYYLLQSDCDQALRDTARYNGERAMRVGYNEEHDFMESYFEDRDRISTWQDRASRTWRTQCLLYIIGSVLVLCGKVLNYKE